MNFIAFLLRRPFITITISLICVLAILDRNGFFRSPSRGDAAIHISQRPVTVQGWLRQLPEEKKQRTAFILQAQKLNDMRVSGRILVNYYGHYETVTAGDMVQVIGVLRSPPGASYPGGFDYAEYLQRQNIYSVMSATSVTRTGYVRLPFYLKIAYALRRDILAAIDKWLPPEEAAILAPMLIGDKTRLSAEEKQSFTDAGVMHILVVSGLNVGFVALLAVGFWRFLGLSRRYSSLLAIPCIIIYVLVTGANPPVVRAAVMALFVILSLTLSRRPDILQSLCMAAAAILAFNPQDLFTASFQLSFAATIGIVYLYPPLMSALKWAPRRIRKIAGGTIAVSLGAQLAVAPLIAFYFNKISVIGLLSNIVVVPLAGVITVSGMVLYAAHCVSPFLAGLAGAINYFLIHSLVILVHFFAQMPASAINIASPPLTVVVLYYISLAAILHLLPRDANQRETKADGPALKQKPLILIAAAVVCVIVGAGATIALRSPSSGEKICMVFLDSGSSEACHIRFPSGKNWLFIGGNSNPANVKTTLIPYLRSRGVRRIEKIFVTRLPATALKPLADDFNVAEIILPPGKKADISADNGTILRETRQGEHFSEGAATLQILSTGSARTKNKFLLMALDYGQNRILFAGNLNRSTAQELLKQGINLQSTILFTGLNTASTLTPQLCQALACQQLILPVRKNLPPHQLPPHKHRHSLPPRGSLTINIPPHSSTIE
ncbi:MAG: DNA internalization-related competence protein ComEC/Rec2 [Elusimicrobia bacterium RIFOXYB2_FULL_50_12]|nr:MAG: DNA internalization-related competence protein ComEC/Rec2 [Elusimicrobia bacterium RIFOXYB2_FULL_50_12]